MTGVVFVGGRGGVVSEPEYSRISYKGQDEIGAEGSSPGAPNIGFATVAAALDELRAHPKWCSLDGLEARRGAQTKQALGRSEIGELHVPG